MLTAFENSIEECDLCEVAEVAEIFEPPKLPTQ